MSWYHATGIIIGYALCGNLYALTYVLVFKPQAAEAMLGFYIVAWPLLIVLDILLAIVSAFGKTAKVIYAKMKLTGT